MRWYIAAARWIRGISKATGMKFNTVLRRHELTSSENLTTWEPKEQFVHCGRFASGGHFPLRGVFGIFSSNSCLQSPFGVAASEGS
jgi:hypothetical protein